MGLAIALDLGRLVKRLPAGAVFGIFAVNSFTIERLDNWKHPAVTQIAVVRERKNFGAGLFLAHRHPLPEVARIWTAQWRQRGERFDETRLCSVVAPNDISMKVVAASVGGPLIADESCEAARFIGFFRRLDRFAPRAAIGRRSRRGESLGQLPLAEAGNYIKGCLRTLSGIDLVVPLPTLRRRQQAWIASNQLREEAHAVRMVRHHQEIQRTRKFGALSAGSDNFFALGKTIGILWPQPSTECAGVHRVRGVGVRVAEVRPRREIAARIWRVWRRGGESFIGCLLLERADVGSRILCGRSRGKHACSTNSGQRGSGDGRQTEHHQCPYDLGELSAQSIGRKNHDLRNTLKPNWCGSSVRR